MIQKLNISHGRKKEMLEKGLRVENNGGVLQTSRKIINLLILYSVN